MKPKSLYLYLLALTGFLILLEISFFIQSNKAYLGDFEYVTAQLHIPMAVLPSILFFICAQFIVHISYATLVWWISYTSAKVIRVSPIYLLRYGILIWCIGFAIVLTANQVYFPNSKFSGLTRIVLFNGDLVQIVWYLSKLLLIVLISSCCIGTFMLAYRRQMLARLCILLSLTTLSFLFLLNRPTAYHDAATPTKPNIFIIGIDSLRPDFVTNERTPFISQFSSTALMFENALTPLARTFPSWMSLLTGQYPIQSGLRSNLMIASNDILQSTLPNKLRDFGYETIFATDETRFSNIDTAFGFNQVISPPIGLNDFLLGSLNDFPLSNLLINSEWGAWLFPYSYMNRAAYVTYQPQQFIDQLESKLSRNPDKPIFMAIHFCLPHFPYLWAALPEYEVDWYGRYEASIKAVDSQLSKFFEVLTKRGWLNNAIVVLLSDHGEALALSGDRITKENLFVASTPNTPTRFYPETIQDEAYDQSAGHGTDVLGLSQYRVLLGLKFYGALGARVGKISQRVTLLDVKPTILEILNIAERQVEQPDIPKVRRQNGNNLLRYLSQQKSANTKQFVFLESDFSPAAMRVIYPEIHDVMLAGVHLFKINPQTTRLSLREDMFARILKSKQYAVIYGDWMLALYPQTKPGFKTILINLKSGKWTDNLSTQLAQHSPAETMLLALHVFYGDELKA